MSASPPDGPRRIARQSSGWCWASLAIAAMSSMVRPLERLLAKTAKASAATAAAVSHEARRCDIGPTVPTRSTRVNPRPTRNREAEPASAGAHGSEAQAHEAQLQSLIDRRLL